VFLELVRQSNVACQSGDFSSAVTLYSEALKIDPSNHILYSNRSAAFIKMGQFGRALQDALKAKELNPKWPKVSRIRDLLATAHCTIHILIKVVGGIRSDI